MNKPFHLLILAAALTLTACGGSDSSASSVETPAESETPEDTDGDSEAPTEEGNIYGPYATGSTSEPVSVYFDLDTATALQLSDQEAATNTQWDIGFRRTQIFLNSAQDPAVGVYFTGNNNDFFDADGNPLADNFINATADSELEDYLAVTVASIPDDAEFVSDAADQVIGDSFYLYDMTSHVVSAADEVYYIVASDDNYSKFHVTGIETEGRALGEITLGIAHQSVLDGASEFAQEVSLTLNALGCSEDLYIDFALQQAVTASDAWDLTIPCSDGAAEFTLTLADDATVIRTDADSYTGIDPEAAPYYGFSSDAIVTYGFDTQPWYYYDGTSHLLYSQFGVYLIKTADSTYKFQITSYYDDEGTSGSFSFRTDVLTDE